MVWWCISLIVVAVTLQFKIRMEGKSFELVLRLRCEGYIFKRPPYLQTVAIRKCHGVLHGGQEQIPYVTEHM